MIGINPSIGISKTPTSTVSRRPPTRTARVAWKMSSILPIQGLKNGLHNKIITCRASLIGHRILIYHVKHGPSSIESKLNMADVHTAYPNGASNHLLSVIAEKPKPSDTSQKNVSYDHIMADSETF
ncbi:hypothetical protein JTB14_014462 [Gonioctena quinquepunctata]|nr:hypothetical protein JTB14_014462 [Gonioctena quinquepunctata]